VSNNYVYYGQLCYLEILIQFNCSPRLSDKTISRITNQELIILFYFMTVHFCILFYRLGEINKQTCRLQLLQELSIVKWRFS